MSTNVPIASVTLSDASSSVTLSGIPQTYTDLIAVIEGTATTSFGQVQMRFNGDTGSNYSTTYLWGTGSAAVSDRDSNISTGGSNVGFIGTGRGTNIINIQNYSNTTTYKTAVARASIPGNRVAATVNLWRNIAAVNEVRFNILGGDTFASGSTFNLYGINAANSGQAKATGGDSIYRDASYWYHVFNKSGTFTPTQALTCDYLVVAGGGGGGHAGGGGAGGFRTLTSQSLTSQSYAVTVGAGGSRYIYNPNTPGSNGSDSTFNGLTSTGGGRGSTGTYAASNGGSGGGGNSTAYGGGFTTAGTSSPVTSPVQGYAGGGGGGGLGGGGGGGAGGAGSAQSGDTGGAGGVGASSSITGSSITYAGGGGGGGSGAGAGGSGGGGAGATGDNNATSGTANTGSGGGGSRVSSGSANTGITGQGGSGIVIVRYPV